MRYWKSKLKQGPSVGIVVASYLNEDLRRTHALISLLASISAQTYQNWRVKIVHDGPINNPLPNNELIQDPRVEFICTQERKLQHGHPHRRSYALSPFTCKSENSTALPEVKPDYLMFTNDDNYYMP